MKKFFLAVLYFFINSSLLFLSSCGSNKSDGQPAQASASFVGDDPYYSLQWHLKNDGSLGGTSGEDINVQDVWSEGNKGDDILITVVDDGVELGHVDLVANNQAGASYDYTTGSTSSGGSESEHGTQVAGIIAARDMNGKGMKGVASRGKIASYNMLEGNNSTDANIQDALSRNASSVFVSNNSWGYVDNKGHFFPMVTVWKTGLNAGLSSGRGGKGTVYVWSAGNGGTNSIDNANYDGLTNHMGVISVCAVGDNGVKASYSEMGANLWVCAPSLGASGVGIATTDLSGGTLGRNKSSSSTDMSDRDYTKRFNGTSASAPIVSGVVALMLKANPQLTWRDVKLILAESARKNDAGSAGWSTNGANFNIHHSYGFGVADAEEAVRLAKNWSLVGTLVTKTVTVNGPWTITDGLTNYNIDINVGASNISEIEFVEVTVEMNHSDWGEVQFTLKRVGGPTTSSELSYFHPCYQVSGSAAQNCAVQGTPNNQWTFGSSRHLGEAGDGQWQLEVDEEAGGTNGGTIQSVTLKIYGH